MTHPSLSSSPDENNQRLEFLGDAVLGLSIAHLLYSSFPTFREGDLAKMKSYLCSQKVLADKSQELGLDKLVLLGEGEEKTGGRKKPSVLADAFEAVLGAYFLDQGFEAAREWITEMFKEELPHLIHIEAMQDFKSMLQEKMQKRHGAVPKYIIKKKLGPAHDPLFHVECLQGKTVIGKGKGKSKKEAEQEAAKDALKNL